MKPAFTEGKKPVANVIFREGWEGCILVWQQGLRVGGV